MKHQIQWKISYMVTWPIQFTYKDAMLETMLYAPQFRNDLLVFVWFTLIFPIFRFNSEYSFTSRKLSSSISKSNSHNQSSFKILFPVVDFKYIFKYKSNLVQFQLRTNQNCSNAMLILRGIIYPKASERPSQFCLTSIINSSFQNTFQL